MWARKKIRLHVWHAASRSKRWQTPLPCKGVIAQLGERQTEDLKGASSILAYPESSTVPPPDFAGLGAGGGKRWSLNQHPVAGAAVAAPSFERRVVGSRVVRGAARDAQHVEGCVAWKRLASRLRSALPRADLGGSLLRAVPCFPLSLESAARQEAKPPAEFSSA